MNNGHLPAGRAGGHGSGSGPGGDMGPNPGSGSRRGRGHQHYQPHYHPHQQQHQYVNSQMYANYINPYAAPYNYQMPPPQHFAHQNAMNNGYMSYPQQQQQQQAYSRSPPSMQHYTPAMPGNMVSQYPRHQPQSPVVVSSPYTTSQHQHSHQHQHQNQNQQSPQQRSPVVVSTPTYIPPTSQRIEVPSVVTPVSLPGSSTATQSPRIVPAPSSPALSRDGSLALATTSTSATAAASELAFSQPSETKDTFTIQLPFRAPLPWLSRPDLPFPARKSRIRKRRTLTPDGEDVQLPINPHDPPVASKPAELEPESARVTPLAKDDRIPPALEKRAAHAPSKSVVAAAIPIVPALPKAGVKDVSVVKGDGQPDKSLPADRSTPSDNKDVSSHTLPNEEHPSSVEEVNAQVKPAAPKLWTGLFSRPGGQGSAASRAPNGVDGHAATTSPSSDGPNSGATAFPRSNTGSLAEALRSYRVGNADKTAFLEPRGLINTGNMCYMNSVLQVLVFCVPFYNFLDQASKKAAHSFKSETPLIDAMIMFMREYKVIDSAISVEQLRRRLKSEELEQYGDAFTPEFVYEAFKPIARFANMRRGHQQDAEEFLGLLLESLNEECALVMRAAPELVEAGPGVGPTVLSVPSDTGDTSGWLEVGPKQRAAVTRSSGHASTNSPVNRIFGGQLRSELRIPGRKDSVTIQPFQQLPLDIGSPQVRNVLDALRGLTRPETIHGDFDSPRGKDIPASKQVFIESLPPVLILHLKRFEFDAQGNGTVKIWKKVGYPLELEIPREVFSRQKRNTVLADANGPPKYRLTGVVYHHGKHANGGHYTVDVRRQDGREWVRLDDTVIRRIRSEDVAAAGAEGELPKPQDGAGKSAGPTNGSSNRFTAMDENDSGDEEQHDWKQVNATTNGNGKKWSNVVNGGNGGGNGNGNGNGTAAPKNKPAHHNIKDNIKDNKVAYLLLYQRV